MTDWATTMLRHMDYQACSASFIAVDGELAGLLVFLDTVRRETPQTLRRLRNRGIERIVMLTGDRLETAEMIALSAGIDELRAGLTPEDKVQAVQQGCQRASTLMVGDGINDAPALAAANVGVAMGASGATASAQAAGVVLLVDRLDRLVEALDVARHTLFYRPPRRAGRDGNVLAGHGAGGPRLSTAVDRCRGAGGHRRGDHRQRLARLGAVLGAGEKESWPLSILITCKLNTSNSVLY
nr:hypothetical protein GCM10020185_73380 [Pseudomonas brassicacearum subsp. brassicacearum]